MSQSKFDIDYYNWLRKIEVTEADSAWEEIQYELDFADTWENISIELDRVAPVTNGWLQRSLIKTAVIATTMLFLMLVPTKKLEDPGVSHDLIALSDEVFTGNIEASPNDNLTEAQAVAQLESTPEQGIETIQNEGQFKKSITESSGKTDVEKRLVNTTATVITAEKSGISDANKSGERTKPALPINDDNRVEKSDKEILPNAVLTEIQTEGLEELDPGNHAIQPGLVFNNINDRKFISDINREVMVKEFFLPFSFFPESESGNMKRSVLKLLDLGIIYSYKNTWLINYETLNGLNREKLGNTLPTFHKDIGISSTFLLTERHSIGLDFMIKSEVGQNYEQYINASYLRRNIQLNYTKLQGYYIWNRERIPGQLLTGGYLAMLNVGEESQGDEKITISDNYSNYDYGLMVGYRLNIFLQNRLIVRPGIRLNYNLVNIFQGDELTPGYLKDTRNFSAGFKISLSYRFTN